MVAEETSVVEEAAPVVAETAVEETLVAEDSPAVEETAVAEDSPVVEETDAKVVERGASECWIVGESGKEFYLFKLEGNAWIAKSVDDFYATADPNVAEIVYAHGYQTDMIDATQDALIFKATLENARRIGGEDRAFRLVVWKWNSERDAARIRVDAQMKARVAERSGRALARFLEKLDPNADLALVGFSFGARVVGSALETLATDSGRSVANAAFDETDDFAFAVSGALVAQDDADDAEEETAQADVDEPYSSEADVEKSGNRKLALILVSAACDLGSFENRGVYGRGASLPTDVLNVYNPTDFALKYYRHVSETRSDAQGVAPVRYGLFPNAVGKTLNLNSRPVLGSRHSFVDALGTIPTQTLGELAF